MISKKKKKTVIGINEDIPEGIYGKIDMPADNSTKHGHRIGKHYVMMTDLLPVPKTIKKRERNDRQMPDLPINYESRLPPEAEGLNVENVVTVPDTALKRVVKRSEKRTKNLTRLMMDNITPSMIAFDSASNYVKAALRDGLNLEVEVDRGVLDVVKELSRLDVVFFYVQRLNIPKSMKKHFMATFIEELSKSSIETMRKTDTSARMSSQLREMEAVVSKRSDRPAGVGGSKRRLVEQQVQTRVHQPAGRSKAPIGAINTPMAGGF